MSRSCVSHFARKKNEEKKNSLFKCPHCYYSTEILFLRGYYIKQCKPHYYLKMHQKERRGGQATTIVKYNPAFMMLTVSLTVH